MRKYKKFLNTRARKFHFPKNKKFYFGVVFFYFSSFGLKSALGSYFCRIVPSYIFDSVFNMSRVSEYVSGLKYVMVLNMAGF